eukprot:6463676-Amphidinium_carterae.5
MPELPPALLEKATSRQQHMSLLIACAEAAHTDAERARLLQRHVLSLCLGFMSLALEVHSRLDAALSWLPSCLGGNKRRAPPHGGDRLTSMNV